MKTENLAALVSDMGIDPSGLSRDELIDVLEPSDGVQEAQAAEEPQADTAAMNDLARRIWEGQSISLHHVERVRRIAERLRAKGYDLEGLVLPVSAESMAKGIK